MLIATLWEVKQFLRPRHRNSATKSVLVVTMLDASIGCSPRRATSRRRAPEISSRSRSRPTCGACAIDDNRVDP